MKIKISALMLTLIVGLSAQAQNFSGCKVYEIVMTDNANGHVGLDCNLTGRPACAAAANYVAFDKSTAEGKQWLATFMLAYATDGKLTGYITDSCPTYQTNVARLIHLRLSK